MKWFKTAALMGATALLAWPAASQSLTDAAAKEKERRAKAKAGKVYTDRELQSAGSGFDTASTSAAAAEPSSDASPKPAGAATPLTPEEELAKKQDEWRKRRDKVAAEVTAQQGEADRIQGLLNDNTKSPYGPARQEAMTLLEGAKAKAAAAQQQLAGIEDEGRRNRYR